MIKVRETHDWGWRGMILTALEGQWEKTHPVAMHIIGFLERRLPLGANGMPEEPYLTIKTTSWPHGPISRGPHSSLLIDAIPYEEEYFWRNADLNFNAEYVHFLKMDPYGASGYDQTRQEYIRWDFAAPGSIESIEQYVEKGLEGWKECQAGPILVMTPSMIRRWRDNMPSKLMVASSTTEDHTSFTSTK